MNSEVLRKILVAGAAVAALSVAARKEAEAAEREDGDRLPPGERARARLERYRAAQCSTPKRIDPG